MNTRPWNQHWSQLAVATLILVYVVEFYVSNHNSFIELWWETLLYVCAIGLMGITATLRDKTQFKSTYYRILTGALLFIISDSLLAINKFIHPFDFANLLVMMSYAFAQLLLITGIAEFALAVLKNKKNTAGDFKKSH